MGAMMMGGKSMGACRRRRQMRIALIVSNGVFVFQSEASADDERLIGSTETAGRRRHSSRAQWKRQQTAGDISTALQFLEVVLL